MREERIEKQTFQAWKIFIQTALTPSRSSAALQNFGQGPYGVAA
jgi:hypothetical protein